MPNNIKNKIIINAPEETVVQILKSIQVDEHFLGSVDFEKIIPMPDNIFRGNLGNDEKEKYGKNNWYDWSCENWGTKWNAYEWSPYNGGKEICFYTAWTKVLPIVQKLSEMFPNVSFEYFWADEDFGSNTGSVVCENGNITEGFIPTDGSKKAYELASKILGHNPSDYYLILNADESNYIPISYKKYELIELFEEPALFSYERLTDADIPIGLHSYQMRNSDDGGEADFATIEPKVKVNYGGTVITTYLMDFGTAGYIEFTEDTAPNFSGEFATFEQLQTNNLED